jgi:hypothetical protein
VYERIDDRGVSTMSHTRKMLDAAPRHSSLDPEALAAAIDALADCAITCTACADACLFEDGVADLRACIALDVDCADVCTATARILARRGRDDQFLIQRQLQACVRACSTCADECERHAGHHEHCAVCAEACRACAQACSVILDAEAQEELQALRGG